MLSASKRSHYWPSSVRARNNERVQHWLLLLNEIDEIIIDGADELLDALEVEAIFVKFEVAQSHVFDGFGQATVIELEKMWTWLALFEETRVFFYRNVNFKKIPCKACSRWLFSYINQRQLY